MAWTTPRTWASGALTAADLNTDVRDNETWIKDALTLHGIDSATTLASVKTAAAGCMAVRAASQTNAAGSNFNISFNEADAWDSHAYHAPGGANPERITIPAGMGGLYLIYGTSQWNSGSAPIFGRLRVQKNIATPSDSSYLPGLYEVLNHTSGGGAHYINVSGPAVLIAGDYLTLTAYASDTGGAISWTDSYFTVIRIASS